MKEAFSLMEVLIVIAVISVLAALLMPVLNKMMAEAGGARCMGNLRQIGAGFHGYVAEFGELPPYINDNAAWFDGKDDKKSFFAGNFLGTSGRDPRKGLGGTGKGELLDCPTIKDKGKLAPTTWAAFDYAYNITLTGSKLTALNSASRTVLVTEGGDEARVKAKYAGSPKYTPFESKNPGGTGWSDVILYPHGGRAHFLYVDGHVESHLPKDLTESWFDGKW